MVRALASSVPESRSSQVSAQRLRQWPRLAIARRVVERHGGSLRVRTARGEGSTFTIELPA